MKKIVSIMIGLAVMQLTIWTIGFGVLFLTYLLGLWKI